MLNPTISPHPCNYNPTPCVSTPALTIVGTPQLIHLVCSHHGGAPLPEHALHSLHLSRGEAATALGKGVVHEVDHWVLSWLVSTAIEACGDLLGL